MIRALLARAALAAWSGGCGDGFSRQRTWDASRSSWMQALWLRSCGPRQQVQAGMRQADETERFPKSMQEQ